MNTRLMDGAPFEVDVVDLVDCLVDRAEAAAERAVRAEVERDEALAMGHQLADQRDKLVRMFEDSTASLAAATQSLTRTNRSTRQLQAALERALDTVAEIAVSPAAFAVRARLRAVLKL